MNFVFWTVKFDLLHFVKYIYDYNVTIISLTILKTKKTYIWQIAPLKRKFYICNVLMLHFDIFF